MRIFVCDSCGTKVKSSFATGSMSAGVKLSGVESSVQIIYNVIGMHGANIDLCPICTVETLAKGVDNMHKNL